MRSEREELGLDADDAADLLDARDRGRAVIGGRDAGGAAAAAATRRTVTTL